VFFPAILNLTPLCSVADPDLHRFTFFLVGWIRIQKGQKLQKSEEILVFEVLDDSFCGLKTSPVALTSFM
jgi:hypothetical protein